MRTQSYKTATKVRGFWEVVLAMMVWSFGLVERRESIFLNKHCYNIKYTYTRNCQSLEFQRIQNFCSIKRFKNIRVLIKMPTFVFWWWTVGPKCMKQFQHEIEITAVVTVTVEIENSGGRCWYSCSWKLVVKVMGMNWRGHNSEKSFVQFRYKY